MGEEQLSTEELNSNLDYFLDVEISKENEELVSTLVMCGRQECDLEKLKRLFEKLGYSEKEIKKFNLNEAKEKTVEETVEEENVKRFKVQEKTVEEEDKEEDLQEEEQWDYDLEKVCENYSQIKIALQEILEDKEIEELRHKN